MVKNKLNEIYFLYESGKYDEALILNAEILRTDAENIYAKRYASLLSSKINKGEKKEIPKVKGKQLKCPHCLSKISITALTEEQQNKIKGGKYSNLALKCPYCHTEFILQKKSAKSIIGIKIGDKIQYNLKGYRVTGYVEYSGSWIEGDSRGVLYYLEWILLGKDNSYLYFSEGYSVDEGTKSYEFEFSEKYTPKGNINLKSFKEKNLLNVRSIYGENSKSFKIGQKTEILDFGYYVYEKEGSGSQLEGGFYRGDNISKKEAFKIFNKDIDVSVRRLDTRNSTFFNILLFGFVLGPILSFIIVQPLLGFFDKKENIQISKIKEGKKFNIIYTNKERNKKIVNTQRYDYGGTRTTYERNIGIQFSVFSDDDKKIIKNISNNGEKYGNEILNISKGKAYIIK